MTDKLEFSSVINTVMMGEFDSQLTMLNKACCDRMKIARDIRASTLAATLVVGTHVDIARIKPRYLEGRGIVTAINRSSGKPSASVKYDTPVFGGRRMHESTTGIPLSCLDVVE